MSIRYQIILILSICLALISLVSAQQDGTDTLPDEGNIVIVPSAFVRSGPSDNYLEVGALFEGDTVFPLNISENGDWVLIPYSRGNGWIQRSLVRWEDEAELNTLPILEANITPTPRIAITNTPFIPTATPTGNYINTNATSAYVRAGPGRGFLRLGQLSPGDPVTVVARNENISWVMIEFSNDPEASGFGWLATNLIYWEDFEALNDLPIVDPNNLTPTATFTASATVQPTNTDTPTTEPTSTNTPTAEPTNTDTPTAEPTSTNTPTAEPTSTNTPTTEPTATDTPTAEPTSTNTPTAEPTRIDVDAVAIVITETVTLEPTETTTATDTSSVTPTEQVTDVFAVQETALAEANILSTQEALNTPPIEEQPNNLSGLPWEALLGAILFLLVVIYVWFYWQGLSQADRYANGFVVDTCPVCQRGNLELEQRTTRILGIPNTRHTVRCDVCRSVLRQTGTERWRYAVDRLENPTMYERFNGRQVTDTDLQRLAKMPVQNPKRRSSPEFVETPDDEG